MSVPVMAHTVEIEDSVPNTAGSTPSLTANTNGVHTPPATGGISVPQSPAGTSTTNTGRTTTATQTMLGKMVIS